MGAHLCLLHCFGSQSIRNSATVTEDGIRDVYKRQILDGLAAVKNRSSIRVISQRPLVILDACRTPIRYRETLITDGLYLSLIHIFKIEQYLLDF